MTPRLSADPATRCGYCLVAPVSSMMNDALQHSRNVVTLTPGG
ncbi:hypothetical protein A2U01_0029932, partial [Trifolium medium]|nr:hypothetical protein [Trifolium medium]